MIVLLLQAWYPAWRLVAGCGDEPDEVLSCYLSYMDFEVIDINTPLGLIGLPAVVLAHEKPSGRDLYYSSPRQVGEIRLRI
jgi:hypothetical protein